MNKFSFAAKQGNALAQFNLGLMYVKGEGVFFRWRKVTI
jgi:TPR repeat protein